MKIKFIKNFYTSYKEKLGQKGKERNRLVILSLSYIFLLDYLMFSFHADKNIFNIFPSIPAIEDRREINVYFPTLDGKNFTIEKRFIPNFNSKERLADFLIGQILKGSNYENTTQTVPIDLFIRKIWIKDDSGNGECIIDIVPAYPEETLKFIPGSEEVFRGAVIKTLKENISGIENVHFLVRGIPGKKLWEI